MADKLRWLYVPNAKPAKELSKHDQRMIRLGWDAHKSFFKSQVEGLTVIHAYGCTTNLAIIGATCNCGAEAQMQADKDKLLGGE